MIAGWSDRSEYLPMRIARALLSLALIGLVLALAAQLTFRPDPLDQLRAADALFQAGRYYEARAAYLALTASDPAPAVVFVRLGMLATIRGETNSAIEAFATALGRGITGDEYDLTRLYQGELANRTTGYSDALALWSQIPLSSALIGQRHMLEGQRLLRLGDYPAAELALRTALAADLPGPWRAAAHHWLALLRGSSDPATARVEFASAAIAPERAQGARPVVAFADPLRPATAEWSERLAAALQQDGDIRAQLLGQLYLDQGLYPLAKAQFMVVDPAGPQGLAAAAYAAYTHWISGDRAGGLERLRTLVEQYPQEPRARGLLALVALSTDDLQTARDQLEALRRMAPNDPATSLAWGQWQAAQRDYLAAVQEYRRALERATPDDQGVYALYLARFYLDSTIEVCESGLPVAQVAAQSQPPRADAWVALAQARLACRDANGAQAAAAQALELEPQRPDALFLLGKSLASLGDHAAARRSLIAAADAKPDSPWRSRSEMELESLGLR